MWGFDGSSTWPQMCLGSSFFLQPGLYLRVIFSPISLLSFHLTLLLWTSPCHPHSLWDFPLFPTLFCILLFWTSGHWIEDKVASTSVSALWHSFNLFSLCVFSSASVFHCLGWLRRRKMGRREDTATWSRSKGGKRGECKLLSRLQRTAERHECEY